MFVVGVMMMSKPAVAQSRTPTIRGDVSGTIAWLLVESESPGPYRSNDWHGSFFAAAGAGWHWSDHLKTELDFGAGTEWETYYATPVTIDGRPNYVATESSSAQRTLGVSQQYQFFRNAWFHPHIAVGANITWQTITDEIQPIVVYDGRSGPRVVQPARTEGPRTEVTVRPFLATGFKAYVTRRGFFRTDLRMGVRSGIDEVLLRLGFGIDF